MKCILLFLLLFPFFVDAQIEIKKETAPVYIGKVKAGYISKAELFYKIIDDDTVYTLMFKNEQYKTLVDYEYISFSNQDGTLQKLYELFKTVFTDENKKNKDYQVKFTLGESSALISNWRLFGNTSAYFSNSKGYCVLTENNIELLFGKK